MDSPPIHSGNLLNNHRVGKLTLCAIYYTALRIIYSPILAEGDPTVPVGELNEHGRLLGELIKTAESPCPSVRGILNLLITLKRTDLFQF